MTRTLDFLALAPAHNTRHTVAIIMAMKSYRWVSVGDYPSFKTSAFRSFWDTGQYRGTIPASGLARDFASTLGLAEYSNAFFVTDDTMFTDDTVIYYPRPDKKIQRLALNGTVPAKHRFPHPSLLDTNVKNTLAPTLTSLTLDRSGDSFFSPILAQGPFYFNTPEVNNLCAISYFNSSFFGPGNIGLTDINREAHLKNFSPRRSVTAQGC